MPISDKLNGIINILDDNSIHTGRSEANTVEEKLNVIAKLLAYDKNQRNEDIQRIINKNPALLQEFVADGRAKEYFNIGDEIIIPWTDNSPSTPVTYQYPFIVVDIADCYDDNDVKHENALWLMAKYTTPNSIPFDAAEDTTVNLTSETTAQEDWYYWGLTDNTYTALQLSTGDNIPTTYDSVHKCAVNHIDVLTSGYSRWKFSAIRQWLNSDVAKNTGWWISQHTGDIIPSSTYTNMPGWLNGFTNEWKEIFKPVKLETNVFGSNTPDTTYDKFFIGSATQYYYKGYSTIVDEDYWPYWKKISGKSSASQVINDTLRLRKISDTTGNYVNAFMRSPVGEGYVYAIPTTGTTVFGYTSKKAIRYQPACVIY